MAISKEKLAAQIRNAFSGVTLGDGITLHEATAIDDYASEAARKAARLKDADTHWSEVPDEHIAANYSVFSFFDIKGHIYYALKRPGFRGGSNTGEWSHEEVPEVFA